MNTQQLIEASSAPRQRARLLDESEILRDEASFATVVLNQRIAPQTHSALREFLAKFSLTWKRMTLALLLVVSVCAVTTVILKITRARSNISSHPAEKTIGENSAPQPKPTATQTEVLTASEFLESPAVSQTENQMNESLTSAGVAGAKPSGAVATKLDIPDKELPEEAKSQAPSKSRSKIEVRSRTEPSSLPANSRQRKLEAESRPLPLTSVGQRPRRVAPKTDSQPESAQTGSATVSPPQSSKPKVIQWP